MSDSVYELLLARLLQDVASHLASVAQAARQDWESKK